MERARNTYPELWDVYLKCLQQANDKFNSTGIKIENLEKQILEKERFNQLAFMLIATGNSIGILVQIILLE